MSQPLGNPNTRVSCIITMSWTYLHTELLYSCFNFWGLKVVTKLYQPSAASNHQYPSVLISWKSFTAHSDLPEASSRLHARSCCPGRRASHRWRGSGGPQRVDHSASTVSSGWSTAAPRRPSLKWTYCSPGGHNHEGGHQWDWSCSVHITHTDIHHITNTVFHHKNWFLSNKLRPVAFLNPIFLPTPCSSAHSHTHKADWQQNPADFNTLTVKALCGNRKSMRAAALSTAWIHWVKMINLSIHWYPPGPNYHCSALKEPWTHWSGHTAGTGESARRQSETRDIEEMIDTETLDEHKPFHLFT